MAYLRQISSNSNLTGLQRKYVLGLVIILLLIFGLCAFSALFVWRLEHNALTEYANTFMMDLQVGRADLVFSYTSIDMQNALRETNFIGQFATKKLTGWSFDAVRLSNIVTGRATIEGKDYNIALLFFGSDTGLILAGYDFGDLGRGGRSLISR